MGVRQQKRFQEKVSLEKVCLDAEEHLEEQKEPVRDQKSSFAWKVSLILLT